MVNYRVYRSELPTGRTLGSFETYDEAKTFFDKVVSKPVRGELMLQSLDPEFHWVDKTLERVAEPNWNKKVANYYKRMEEEEEDWHAGDARWNAPGMSVRDFI